MKCVVNLVTTGGWYLKGQARLDYKMRKQNIPLVSFVGEHSVGAPQHENNPYAFKLFAIEKALKMGYKKILWVDASVYPVKDIAPVFDWLDDKGIFLEHAGHRAGSWATEFALSYFGVSKREAMDMPMFAAGYCGFDFTNDVSVKFFYTWKKAMEAGVFKGNWNESRHDMTAGSIIANQQGLLDKYAPGGHFFAYIGEVYEAPKESAVFYLSGM